MEWFNHIRCPYCRKNLVLSERSISCNTCSRCFPIIDGIPSFLEGDSALSKFFDSRAGKYGDSPLSYVNSRNPIGIIASQCNFIFRRYVFERVINIRGKTILDIGCGTGNATDFLLRENALYGMDISRKLLQHAARKGFRVINHSVANGIPFEDAFFDATLLLGVAPYFDENRLNSIFCEIRRVTKRKGKVFISTPVLGGFRRFSSRFGEKNRRVKQLLNEEKILQLASFYGSVRSVYGMFFPVPLYLKQNRKVGFPLSSACIVEIDSI